MPFIRTPKGVKMPFSTAKISEIISLSYKEVYGKNSFQYRREINTYTNNIVSELKRKYGNDKDTEWLYFDLLDEIKICLHKNTSKLDVYNSFLDFYKRETSVKNKETEKIENPKSLFKSREKLDPSWNIYIRRMETEEEFKIRIREKENLGENLENERPREKRGIIQLRQSEWFLFWQKLFKEAYIPFPQNDFLNEVKKDQNAYSKYTSDWYLFWKKFIFEKLGKDPRFYSLLSVLELRKMRMHLIGGNWMLYSDLNFENRYDLKDQIDLDYFSERNINQTYQSLFKQFINTALFADHMKPDLLSGFDLEEISKSLVPDRDRFLDWRAFQFLKQSGSLLEIPIGTQWRLNRKLFTVKEGCFELPQWAYMRLAISLASIEKDSEKTKRAIDFYHLFSTLNIIPTATMLREAGKAVPNYLEDQATIVADKYENIWESIHETAIGTKWTGTVSLDWREVRAKGSPINKGIRFSNGILPFLETINTSLNAQERANDDKPVTNIIPIYHKDSMIFIDYEKHQLNRFNSVLSISDLFLERAKNSEMWTLFDPKIYPEILSGARNDYLIAESKIKDRSKKHPHAHKQKRADKILSKIIQHMQKGRINLVFESNNRAFNLYQKDLQQVNGVEGVGSFNIHKNEEKGIKLTSHWASWPSIAINVLHVVENNGVPNVDKMKLVISNCLRILDNAIFLSQKNDYGQQDEKSIIANRDINDFRHICLGIIGLNETIEKLIDKQDLNTDQEVSNWMRALTSTWQTLILSEEQKLASERGYADIQQKVKNIDYFNPIKAIKQLKKSRDGSLGIKLSDQETAQWKKLIEKFGQSGQRFITKSIYAPFNLPSAIAGVTTGGLGVIMPSEKVFDDDGKAQWVPTALLLRRIDKRPEYLNDYAKVMKYPTDFRKWNDDILQYSHPNPEDWRKIMLKAESIRPWFDQGVCLSLPTDLQKNQLYNLIEQAWFYGITSIRFITREEREDIVISDNDYNGDDEE